MLSLQPTSCFKYVLHVEVALNENEFSKRTCFDHRYIADLVTRYLRTHHKCVLLNTTIYIRESEGTPSNEFLETGINTLHICEVSNHEQTEQVRVTDLEQCDIKVHVYNLNDELEPFDEINEEENVLSAHHWNLPSRSLHGLWESLVYDDDIPTKLLSYMYTAMLFSDSNVNQRIITWNRVVLLHGPPGTGKTSLCKALAQKLCIRLSSRYPYGRLVEINAHSLFSKWFSESGKLVMKMFQSLKELAADEDMFVCVLMDEVESLTAARKSAANGNEPSDAVRVVNAVLTQLDQLRRCKNVLILTTSNMTDAIDLAFVDRADIKQLIGLPSERAIYVILSECIAELARVGILDWNESESPFLDWKMLSLLLTAAEPSQSNQNSLRLLQISQKAKGLSGRALRKIPFLAHAFHIRRPQCQLAEFLVALENTVTQEAQSRDSLMA